MNATTLKLMTLSAVAFATVIFANHARAEAPTDRPPEVSVGYADLNMKKAAGAAALYSRISAAASRVCAETTPESIHALTNRRVCIARAIARAVADVGAPELTRYHVVKTG